LRHNPGFRVAQSGPLANKVANRGESILKVPKLSLAIAVAASLSLPVSAFAADAHGKRHIYRWRGYGFLPGYHQPPDNRIPIYGPQPYSDRAPSYAPRYWYGGGLYYFGNPGFLHGRYNGGSFGPCWTWTPIGLMWNCG